MPEKTSHGLRLIIGLRLIQDLRPRPALRRLHALPPGAARSR
ncbi:hypothetical protein [Streptomyces sp. NBC_01012]|nr:hypothetical protein OG623_07600 [Streptomyces sp. NBC_01012]